MFAGLFRENPCSGGLPAEPDGERLAHGVRLERRPLRAGRGNYGPDPELAPLLQSPFRLRGGTKAAGETDLAESGDPLAYGCASRRRRNRERPPEICAGLVD